jgi:acyl-CoA thioesterase-1
MARHLAGGLRRARRRISAPMRRFIALLFCVFSLSALSLVGVPLSAQEKHVFTVLFLGDSLTEGYGLDDGEAFPDIIADRFNAEGRHDIKVINGGVSGSTSASALGRLRWFVRSKPDLMVLALGANDGLRGLDVNELEKNLSATIELAQQSGIKVALTGMLAPPNMGADYTQAFAAIFPALAERYQLPYLPFLLDGVAGKPELNQGDGIHPNLAGERIVAELVWNFLQPLLPAAS